MLPKAVFCAGSASFTGQLDLAEGLLLVLSGLPGVMCNDDRVCLQDKTPVVVAEQLDLSKYCSRAGTGEMGKKGCETQLARDAAAEQQPRPIYSLGAISKHDGSMGGGHHTALCKSALTDRWLDCDDAVVSEDAAVIGPSEYAYMLFYKRQA